MVHWEFLKYKMRQFSMIYSKEKAFKRKSACLTLEKKVKELESRIRCNSDEALVEQYNKSKNELENLYNYITEGIMLCSKVNWYEYGEKSQWETTKALGMMDSQKNFMCAFFKKFTLIFLMHLIFLLSMANCQFLSAKL